jgi:HNH endonuclease
LVVKRVSWLHETPWTSLRVFLNMNRRTVNGLIARGLDSKTAAALASAGHTLQSLKTSNNDSLRKLGLKKAFILALRDEGRPPIPEPTVIKLLHESRRACCVCRDNSKGVVIHHIVDWSVSQDHSESNLVVLCSDDHGEAHTKRKLQLELTPAQLRKLKKAWLLKVKQMDTKVALGQSPHWNFSLWDYFNHNRLIEIAHGLNVDLTNLSRYKDLVANNRITVDGLPAWGKKKSSYIYEGSILYDHRDAYQFYAQLLRTILDRTAWLYITDEMWDRTHINGLLSIGKILVVKAGFYFGSIASKSSGPGQIRRGLRRKNHIHLSFLFDAWESASTSSWADHLSGHRVVTSVCAVRSITRSGEDMDINATCLALGSGFGPDRWPYNPLRSISEETDDHECSDLEELFY